MFELVAVGNALVDLLIPVEESDLKEAGIDKGTMNLVDENRQNELLMKFFSENISSVSGGSAANTAIAFAQLGGKVGFASAISDDELGERFSKDLLDEGVAYIGAVVPGELTGSSLILVTPDAERSMNTNLGIAANLEFEFKPELHIAPWLFFEGYLLAGNPADSVLSSIEKAKASGTKIALTLSDPFVVNIFRDKVEQALKSADFVFANLEEGKSLTGSENIDEIVKKMKSFVPRGALTVGADGAVLWDNDLVVSVPAVQVTPVDLTGAGDAFAGGVLFGLLKAMPLAKCGKIGCEFASKVVSLRGARLIGKQNLNSIA